MSRIADARAELAAALDALDGLVVVPDGANIRPPAVLVLPPTLAWTGFAMSATFDVTVVVRADERATERLFELLEPVRDACLTVTDATCASATPSLFPAGDGAELPSYILSIEVSL